MVYDPEETVPLTPDQERLVRTHLHIAKAAARRIYRTAPHALEEDELISIAYFGLVQAAQRWHEYCTRMTARGVDKAKEAVDRGEPYVEPMIYDPAREDFFAVYASRRCNGAVMDDLRSKDYATRSLRAKSKRLRAAGQDEGATLAQMSERTGMPVAEISRTINSMQNRPVSLEGEGSDFEIVQTTESESETHDLLRVMVDSVRALPEEEQVVLALHYYQGLQLQQVARELDVPEGYVSQLHTSAVLAVHADMLLSAEGYAEGRDLVD